MACLDSIDSFGPFVIEVSQGLTLLALSVERPREYVSM
jgi:hypothetical protein